MKRVLYRLGQFWRAHTDLPDPALLKRAGETLSEPLFALFLRMVPFEQAHALRVFAALTDGGHTDPDLLAAALLHDVGKVRFPLRPWQRAVAVALRKGFPASVERISRNRPKGWLAGVVVAVHHAQWGAEMAEAAGASPLTVALIARHQDADTNGLNEHERTLLLALKHADERY